MLITWEAARVNKGLTQKQTCEELGIGKNTLISYEKYRTSPDASMAQRMSELYGVPLSNILLCKQNVL